MCISNTSDCVEKISIIMAPYQKVYTFDRRPTASIESDRDYLEFIENETVSSFVLSE